jgi:hypothetical protein
MHDPSQLVGTWRMLTWRREFADTGERTAGVREAGFHTPPDRLLAIWLDGHVEFETSDGEVRRLPAGKAVLVEDTHGKGHISRHPEEGQNVITVILPSGLGAPLD